MNAQLVLDMHQTHHRFLGDYAQDLDFTRLERFAFHEPVGRARMVAHVWEAASLRHFGVYFFCVLSDPREPRWARCLRLALVLGVLAGTLAFPVEAGLFLLVPFIYVYQIDKYLMDYYIDHGGLLRESSPLQPMSRTGTTTNTPFQSPRSFPSHCPSRRRRNTRHTR
jgi:hypothetical protein